MAVSRKAMTEGIRTFLFPSTLCERNLTIPQSLRASSLCTREPLFTYSIHYAKTPLRFRKGVLSVNQEGYQ